MNDLMEKFMDYQRVIAGDQIVAFVLVLVMIGLLTQYDRKKRTNYLFLACLILVVALTADALVFAYDIYHNCPLTAALLFYYAAYTFPDLAVIPLSIYVKAYMEERTSVRKGAFLIPIVFPIVAFVINSTSIFLGKTFATVNGVIIDYEYVPLAAALFRMAGVLYLLAIAYSKREAIGKRTVLLLGLFGFWAMVMRFVSADLSLMTEGIAIIFVYIILQNDTAAEKEKNRRELAKAIKEAESANEAKSRFLYEISHDIRTPMNAIIGFRDLLEKHQEDPIKRADYLKKMEDSSQILLSIINNILEMARIEKGVMEHNESVWNVGQFNDSIFSFFEKLMEEKGVVLTRKIQVKNHYVYCDAIKLREIFINILSNAYKYTEPGGRVEFNLEEFPSSREGYALFQTTISDTGIGMSEEFLPHLFEEFSREKNTTYAKIEGTGLGMPIVKRLVDFLEGTIEVKSKQGVGTTFIVTIPHRIASPSESSTADENACDKKTLRGKRILLAEDQDFNAEIAIEMLEAAGMIVERVRDGKECVDELLQAREDAYDLILMDIQMPNMDGYEATRTIRTLPEEMKANIPILAMTANAFEEDRRRAIEAGMNGYLAKPVKENTIRQALANLWKENSENR